MPDIVMRVTARYFQKRFQKLEEPTLVNNGIFFPELTAELLKVAERMVKEKRGE